MKNFVYVIVFGVLLIGCKGSSPVPSDELVLPEKGQVGIYYFRTPLRCETCDAIEQMINELLEEKHRQQLKSGQIVFRQFNLEDPGVADFALQFDVVFKSLILLKDSRQVNLTEEAFLYVLPKPEKFKRIFEESIDQL